MRTQTLEEYASQRFREIPGFLGLIVYHPGQERILLKAENRESVSELPENWAVNWIATAQTLDRIYENFPNFSSWSHITIHTTSTICSVERNSSTSVYFIVLLDKEKSIPELAGFLLPQFMEDILHRLKNQQK